MAWIENWQPSLPNNIHAWLNHYLATLVTKPQNLSLFTISWLLQERINLLGKMRNLEHDLEVMKDRLDEEYDAKQGRTDFTSSYFMKLLLFIKVS